MRYLYELIIYIFKGFDSFSNAPKQKKCAIFNKTSGQSELVMVYLLDIISILVISFTHILISYIFNMIYIQICTSYAMPTYL